MDHILKCHEAVDTDLVRGDNCDLFDRDNNRFIDFEAGVWCTAIGHNHPRINQAVKNQTDRIMHQSFRYTSRLAEAAAARLLETADLSGGKCIFLSSGSEAMELGVQTARLITGRRKFISLADSYLAAYGLATSKNPEEWIRIDWSACLTCQHPGGCDGTCPLFEGIPFDDLAGFVFEPGSSSGQVRFPPLPMIKGLIDLLKQHHGLVILDEVTTGCGRTGKWWGYQHYGLDPDIVAAGKGIGNGYPVSAAMFGRDCARRLENMPFRWAQSHQNDPLGCRVVEEVLTVMQEENLPDRSAELGGYFRAELERLGRRHPMVKEVRGRGLMIALEIHRDRPDCSVVTLYQKLFERGILVGYSLPGNNIRFYPALTMEEKDIVYLIENLDRIMEAWQ